jgi:hypothetical protein
VMRCPAWPEWANFIQLCLYLCKFQNGSPACSHDSANSDLVVYCIFADFSITSPKAPLAPSRYSVVEGGQSDGSSQEKALSPQ